MPSAALDNALCARPVKERVKIFDTVLSGLYLSKTPTKATFVYKFWDGAAKTQRTVEVGIFDADRFDVKAARAKTKILIGERLQGVDIVKRVEVATIVATKGALSFNEVADLWIKWLQVPVQKAHGIVPRVESWQEYAKSLTRPRAAFGKKRISDVTDDDIASLLHGILDEVGHRGVGKSGSANNTRAALSVFYNWAREAGRKYVPFNPCSNLPKREKKISKSRTLSHDEIRTLWYGLDRSDIPCDRHTALALKLILCTGLRPSEVGLTLRSELDLKGEPVLHVDASRVKLRRPIAQPLNSLALELVREALADGAPAGALFRVEPKRYSNGTGPRLDAWRFSKELRGEKRSGRPDKVGIVKFLGLKKFTAHDLRRTAATLLGEAGVSLGDIAQVLDHAKRPTDGATASTLIYDRSNVNRRRATLDTLDGILRGIIGSKVVKLRVA